MFELERISINADAYSPDGAALVFTRRRPPSSQNTNGILLDNTRDDVWLQAKGGEKAQNITAGASDGSGWWAPQWSPDGRRLAMFSTRGGSVSVWIWDRNSEKLSVLVKQRVDERKGFDWIDSERILCALIPKESFTRPLSKEGRAAARVIEAWQKAERGEVTASALDSRIFTFPCIELVSANAATGTVKTIAMAQNNSWERGKFAIPYLLSPKQDSSHACPRLLAIATDNASRYGFMERVVMGYIGNIELRTTEGEPYALNQPLPNNIITESIQWSPDGRELAFFSFGDDSVAIELLYGENAPEVDGGTHASGRNSVKLYRVNIPERTLIHWETGDLPLKRLDPARLMLPTKDYHWTSNGELFFEFSELDQAEMPKDRKSPVVLRRDGRTQNLASSIVLPDKLRSIDGGKAFLGVAAGHLWKIRPISGEIDNLTEGLALDVKKLVRSFEVNGTVHAVIEASKAQNAATRVGRTISGAIASSETFVLDLTGKKIARLERPHIDAELIALETSTLSYVHSKSGPVGVALWRTSASGQQEVLVEANGFLDHVNRGSARIISFSSLNGQACKAFVILPPDYQPGRRYPLVVDFDIGYSNAVIENYYDHHLRGSVLRRSNLFAAAGFAYMFTSAPSDAMGKKGRANLLQVTDGVLPAAEAAVRGGWSDGGRQFFFGESSAGYGAYAIAGLTSRFKAVVAQAGWTDQVDVMLTNTIANRYRSDANDLWWGLFKAPYMGRHLPFWRNGDQLRRNSPITYVDRVQTPVLIVHGDLDSGIPMEGAEHFFNALVFQRKPAKLLRFWGEGHGIDSPANVKEWAKHLFAWYDEWGDIARDSHGNILFDEKGNVKSRNGAPPLKPEDFAKFDVFGPGGEEGNKQWAEQQLKNAGSARPLQD